MRTGVTETVGMRTPVKARDTIMLALPVDTIRGAPQGAEMTRKTETGFSTGTMVIATLEGGRTHLQDRITNVDMIAREMISGKIFDVDVVYFTFCTRKEPVLRIPDIPSCGQGFRIPQAGTLLTERAQHDTVFAVL